MIHSKEFGLGYNEMELWSICGDLHICNLRNSGWDRQVILNNQKFFITSKDTNPQSAILTACWTNSGMPHKWAHIIILFPWLLYETEWNYIFWSAGCKMSCGRKQGEVLIVHVLASDSGELILSYLTNNHAFCMLFGHAVSSLNHGNKKMFPQSPRHFDLENGVSNGNHYFYEDFNKSTENTEQKVVDILFKYKPILLTYLWCIFSRQDKCKF